MRYREYEKWDFRMVIKKGFCVIWIADICETNKVGNRRLIRHTDRMSWCRT